MATKRNVVTSDFMDSLIDKFHEGKISNILTFDEAAQIAEENHFNYLELLYHLENRGFYIVNNK